MALVVVGVFHAALREESGRFASLPEFQTFLVLTQVAGFTVGPSGGARLAIFALEPHSYSFDVTFAIITPFNKFVAD